MIADKVADYISRYSNGKISFSQSGEDLICSSWLQNNRGFYVDVGCNHPIRLNNTFHFYQRGWSGINIDPDPSAILLHKKVRPLDLNLNLGISNVRQTAQFYIFKPSTLSTFSKKSKDRFIKAGYHIVETKPIACLTLSEVWAKFVKGKQVDILNIDVEGQDEMVIEGNDWNKYRPRFVIVETVQHKPIVKAAKRLDDFFKNYRYHKFADTFINSIYASREFIQEHNINFLDV